VLNFYSLEIDTNFQFINSGLRGFSVLKQVFCAFFGLLACSSLHAQTLDFNLSNDTAEAALFAPFASTGFGKSAYQISVLFSDKEVDNNWMVGGGFSVSGEAGTDVPGLEFGVSINAYIAEVAAYELIALPLGAHARYSPPPLSRFFGKVAVEYAPDIVTFNDADQLVLAVARLGYEILPNADVYLGYRNIQVGIKDQPNSDVTIDKGWHIGVNLTF